MGRIGFLLLIRLYLVHADRALAAAALNNAKISGFSGIFRVNTIVQYHVMMFHEAPLMAPSEYCATNGMSIGLDSLP